MSIKSTLLTYLLLALLAVWSGPLLAQVTVPGINADVTVYEDANGIPTIAGSSELDVAYVQGFLHARDRFFAMDLNRRVASGTSAELFGASQLPDDIQLRTLGLRRAAWATYAAMSADTRAWLQAYANGVNTYLADNPLPPEYAALQLDAVPPWSPVDSIVVGKALAFQLSFDLDIENTILAMAYQQAGQQAGFDGSVLFSQDLVRSAPPDGRVSAPGFLESIGGVMLPAADDGFTVQTAGGKVVTPATAPGIGEIDPVVAELAQSYLQKISTVPMLKKQLQGRENRSGSNAWAVSGEFTSSGYPLIANDPHLSLDVPSVFTEDHIIVTGADGFSASGVSVPGTPGIIQGCTSALCWGSTVHPMDVTDTYQETLKLNRLGLPVATIYQGDEEPITLIFQTYFANNPQDGEVNSVSRANVPLDGGGITFVVPRRNNGPIVDVSGNTGISVQYTGWGPTFELDAFREINRATSMAEFEAALQKFDVGSQNFVYADIDGNIAYFTSAENPIRADLQNDMAPDGGIPPFLIRDGSGALNHEWLPVQNPQPDQAVPFEIMPWAEMPKDINPERGYVANANNDPIGVTLDNNPLNQLRPAGGLYYLNPGYASLRMGRVDRVLQDLVAGGNVTRDDMIALQANNQMLDAEILHPIVLGTLAAFVQPPGSTCPAVFPDAFACDPRMQQLVQVFSEWDFSTPTGIQAGYDPGDDPNNLPSPSATEINHSVAATIFATLRGQLIENSLDAILDGVGLGDFKPGNQLTWNALIRQLVDFDQLQGFGESGVPLLFDPNNPPQGVDARSQLIIGSVISSLLLLESDEFSLVYANSQDIMDYRWGMLHRIVFDHPLNVDPFNIPNGGGLVNLAAGAPGLARAGGYQVVDASTHSVRANGLNEFMFGSGPARRFVGSMTPAGPDGLEVIPGGRSSVPFSPFFADQMPLWLTNDFHPLTISAAQAQAGAVVTTSFSPQ